jgi:AraC-like DNA-binding protein
MGDFLHFEDRASDHPFIEKVWRCRSERADRFLSVAANTFEMAITHLNGEHFFTLRGPETIATSVDCPADGEWICIRFKAGTFIRWLPPGVLRDRSDVTLPGASKRRFWLNGSAVEYPDFENAEVFVNRLAGIGILQRDPIVDDTLRRRPRELSLRSAQRRFLQATGVSYATFRQIERARNAALLLRENASILDVVERGGYFDQAHLTRSLRRFIGETPANVIRREKQLSFLYKTEWLADATLLPDTDS